ncbi:MAG: hypothetical protein ACK5NK_04575 [Niabella sp.]
MKKILLFLGILLIANMGGFAQKQLTEATISYDMVINTNNTTPGAADMLDGATSIVYLKGNSSRADFINSLGTQTTIYDGKTNTATSLTEYGKQRFLITFSQKEWKTYNKKYDSLSYTIENEFKTIAGYNCQKAIGKMGDGTAFVVYFCKDLKPIHNEFLYINKNLPGLAMQYEASQGKAKVTYTVSSIDFGVVPLSKFDLPKTGYSVMTYTESQNVNKK